MRFLYTAPNRQVHNPTFNRSEVIVFTNRQTDKQKPLKTSMTLCYATPVGNY